MFRRSLAALAAVLCVCFPLQADQPVRVGDQLIYPEGSQIPRGLTDVERAFIAEHPLEAVRVTSPPTGPVHCPAEYEPMDGLLLAWESFTNVLTDIARLVTTDGAANVYVVVDSTSERTSAQSALNAGGVNMSRVQFIVRTTDSVWIRDYGPRYIYEGNCRAIVDHTYNRPRPNDDAFPPYFATLKNQPLYEIPLIHGGGNYHLSALGDSYATKLISNENPSLTDPQIISYWQQYQNVNTTLMNPFPTSIDSTQHIDMWMQVLDDRKVMISDWPANPGSTQDVICDNAAISLAAAGYTVYRVPARSVSGTHYTYTNVVICNDLVIVPSYTNTTVSPYNSQALTAWQTACPDKIVRQLNGQDVVTSAGVFHCIVMHVPVNLGGLNPTAYLRNLRGGEELDPGIPVTIQWISDDDVAVQNIDLLLSTDGGANFNTVIASATAPDGSFSWTVPDIYTTQARIRVVARDADGRTGSDQSPADFTINGTPPCPTDLDGNGFTEAQDLALLLASWESNAGGDVDGDNDTDAQDLALLLAAWETHCP